MTLRCLHLIVACVLLLPFIVSCRKKEKVVVTAQRELTMYDNGRDPLVAVMPPEWRQVPGTQFRIFNYRFGKDGEVFVGRAKGGVLANVNRWMGQLGQAPADSLDNLEKVTVLGRQGVLVTTTGDFAGGMGQPPREGAGLAGIIVPVGGGLLTVKMMGDADAVEAERGRLIQFASNLRIRGAHASETTD